MDVYRSFDRQVARAASGLQFDAHVKTVALVGAGALGSQIALMSARMGVGSWSIIDPDHLMPHNLARHALLVHHLGCAKAEALTHEISRLLGPDAAKAIVADVQESTTASEALDSSDLVVDASASVPTARWLSIESPHKARSVSVFLNPAGTEMAILQEGRERSPRLDHVEMTYYWHLANDPRLSTHLHDGRVGLFPSGGCRRPSLQISQVHVGSLASVATQQILRNDLPPEATVEIWRTSGNGMDVVRFDAPAYREVLIGPWTLAVSDAVLAGIKENRRAAGELETGGILVGAWDRVRRKAYVVGSYPPPPDSICTPTSFVRGEEGVFRTIDEVETCTAHNLTYVGEWHTHPPHHGSRLSDDDRKLLKWIGDVLVYSDVPPVMAVAGRDGLRFSIGAADEVVLT